ncbi:MAG: LUD domain-containing protein [Planctomycetaceae bacterium]|nr:LUD domain-containing protein [Planctomycetaceae bacterium]
MTTAPSPFSAGIVFDDPVAQFSQVLRSVGGRCESAGTPDIVESLLREQAEQVAARNICSLGVNGSGSGLTTFDLGAIHDPHDLDVVDLAILPGRLAVAENGAVWTTATSPLERTLYFLTQHLVLIVPRDQVFSNLHEAYTRVDVTASPFGCWISGPSKTADIEQSLVLGAHGPRSLLVLLT